MAIKVLATLYGGLVKRLQPNDSIVPQASLIPDISYTIYSNNCLILTGTFVLGSGITITQQSGSMLRVF